MIKFITAQQAENLNRVHGQNIKLPGLGVEAKIFVKEMKKIGVKIPIGHNYAACTDQQIYEFLSWRNIHRKETGEQHIVLELSPFLRRFLREIQHFLPNNQAYLGNECITMSLVDHKNYIAFNKNLRLSIDEELEN